jgi:hypothetical protein
LPNLSVKADSLLMKQLCRILTLPNEDSFRMVGYWLGSFRRTQVWEKTFLNLLKWALSPTQ